MRLNTDTEIGLPLETCIVNEGLSIEAKDLSEEKERLKAYQSVHIFIASDDEKDAAIIRKRFQEWRKQIYQSKEVE